MTYTVTKAARSVSMVFARITIQWYCGVRKYNFISVVLAKQSDKELHVTWFKEVVLKGKCLAVKILTTLQNLMYWKSRIVLLARNPLRTVSYNRSTENKSTPFEGMTLFYFPQSRCSRSLWRQQEHVKIKWPISSTIQFQEPLQSVGWTIVIEVNGYKNLIKFFVVGFCSRFWPWVVYYWPRH